MFYPVALREGLGVAKIDSRVLTDKNEPGLV
jgi:hypothetical protein